MLSVPLVDIDHEIEKACGVSVKEIFEMHGERYFRDVETEMIRKVSHRQGIIISTGGGAVLKEENIRALKEQGIIFCLTASPETILRRTCMNSDRPLLNVPDPEAKIVELLEARMPYYVKAGVMIDTEGKTPLQIAEEIVETMQWKRYE